jgi:glycyl-tRNA synthetase alpha chain
VRNLARSVAESYHAQREKLDFPGLKDEAKRAALGLAPLAPTQSAA